VLDEPSTGLDPLARRRLWDAVRLVTKSEQRSVLLTTHLMEEADALSNTLGIMVAGEIRAAGTPQELKNLLGAVFTVTIVVPVRSDEEMQSLAESFGADVMTVPEAECEVAKFGLLEAFQREIGSADAVKARLLADWVSKATATAAVRKWADESLSGKKSLISESGGALKWEVSDFGSVVGLFKAVEQAKNSGIIGQYTIAQPSLDQVFAKVSAQE